MNNVSEGEKRAIDAVWQALRPLGLPIERQRSPHGPLLVVDGLATPCVLAPLWAGEGFPDDVRRALDRFQARWPPGVALPVVAARHLSVGGRRVAEEADAGWADEAGNSRILARPALAVVREGAPPVRRVPAGWSPSAGAVAELRLTLRARREISEELPPVSVISARVDWSVGQVAKVLAFFDREHWTEKHGGERGPTAVRTFADPAGLLSAWAAWHAREPVVQQGFGAYVRDHVAFVADELAPVLRDGTWCVTAWVALEFLAPFTSSLPTVEVYVDEDAFTDTVEGLSSSGEFRAVEEGARLNVIRAPRHVVTLASRHPFPVASPVRVYGDLLRLGARGEQAADRLRETVLGF